MRALGKGNRNNSGDDEAGSVMVPDGKALEEALRRLAPYYSALLVDLVRMDPNSARKIASRRAS